MNDRTCLDCGEPLRGRADQKFCNDMCRNSYNNKKWGKSTRLIRKINRTLKKNHAILEELNPDGKGMSYRSKLESRGYDFRYHTNIYTTRSGREYFFVYDQGFAEVENGKLILVKNDEN